MEFLLLKTFLQITIFLLGSILFIELILFLIKDKNKNDVIILKAKRTHNNRTLQFTKGKKYRFYKFDNLLMTNEDDISRDRDNYTFCKEELLKNFNGTDYYSKLVLSSLK